MAAAAEQGYGQVRRRPASAAVALGGPVGLATISMGKGTETQEGGHLYSIPCVGWGGGWLERAGHVSSSSARWRQQWREVGGTIPVGWYPELGEERLGRELGQ